ncbi:hypothetical protein Phi10:1_gp035 [Cellulophaga phage phi10:1]|uniref:Uncharacterized protein n=1 Tax=Cellulophaga phage phi10:1 TaxID=1327981 RepID=R9ZZ39_9CAUD|nr:hypothetical protein Phi10:1_gp035 [Cellulophaga phage phi10:1]AGO48376.1 hypothetical protein Phi10:1_gp035 [Cellulophaga phage phi10:1]
MNIEIDYTFAVRLKSLVDSLEPQDACSEDEINSFKHYAETMLRQQCVETTDSSEIDYLKRVGVYDKYNKPLLTTYDGFRFYSLTSNFRLFSCMKDVKNGESILSFRLDRCNNKDRHYFLDKDVCEKYINDNRKSYSLNDTSNTTRTS